MGRLLAPDLVERLREPPACLLEPEAKVEGVCVLAALGCRQEEQHAAAMKVYDRVGATREQWVDYWLPV